MSGLLEIGDRIKKRRIQLEYNQAQLAKLLGIERASVILWESGQVRNIRPDNLINLGKVLRVSLDWLVFGDEPMESHGAIREPNAAYLADPYRVDQLSPDRKRIVLRVIDALITEQTIHLSTATDE